MPPTLAGGAMFGSNAGPMRKLLPTDFPVARECQHAGAGRVEIPAHGGALGSQSVRLNSHAIVASATRSAPERYFCEVLD